MLRSYVQGTWHTASDEGRPLHDAVTGEEVARISSAGVDMAGGAGARAAGGRPGAAGADLPPARRPAQGARRAPARAPRRAVRALGPHRRDALRREVRRRRRHRRRCSAYASKAKRELPNDTVLVEGAVEPLGKGGTFVGQHICTPLHGVAVQVNAFNFPVWGPLEKLAPGVPRRACRRWSSRPARRRTSPQRLVELIVESGLLPEGALQFVCGERRRPARPPHRAGPGLVHRLGRDRATSCAPTRRSCASRCGSTPRPTRSTARSSGPTPRPDTPSSTCTSSSSSPR